MRLEMYAGEVVVAYENESENPAFINEIYYTALGNWLPGFINKRRIYNYGLAIFAAERCGVEVDAAVYEYREEQKRIAAEKYAAECAERARQARIATWQRLCKNGCRGCRNLRRTEFDDEYKCQATGDDLETKNKPGFYGVVHYLFRLEPFPSQRCPHNPENNAD